MRPCLKKTLHKKWVGGVVHSEGPEFKPQYRKKKKNRIPKTKCKVQNSFEEEEYGTGSVAQF
jgi:hypothetical protein